MSTERSEAEEKLGELIRETIDHSDLELDFFQKMDQPPIPAPETFMVGKPDYPNRRWIPYAVKAAVFAIAVLLCSTAMVEFTDRAPATAKPAELTMGTSEYGNTDGSAGESIVLKRYSYSDEPKLSVAKERAKGLLSPTYVPEGYIFQNLYIDVYQSGNWIAYFDYADKNNTLLHIKMLSFQEESGKNLVDDMGKGEMLATGWSFYKIDDTKNDEKMSVCSIDNYHQIIITGFVDYSQMKKIMIEMK